MISPAKTILSKHSEVMNVIQQIYNISRPIQRVFSIDLKRSFSTTHAVQKRQIQEKTEGETTIVEGVTTPTDYSKLLKLSGNKNACSLCKLENSGVKVKYTDVLIVKQFLTPEGYQLPRSITGLCYEQHREMKKLIDHASRAGLLNEFPHIRKPDWKWKKYNVYFEPEDKYFI